MDESVCHVSGDCIAPSSLLDLTIVSGGDWLGNPANIKGRGHCLDFEVDTGGHVTMTVQSFE